MSRQADEKLLDILTKVLLVDKPTINDALSRKDIEGWDSLSHLVLIFEIESAFSVVISDEDIMAIKTIGDIRKVLRKLGVPT